MPAPRPPIVVELFDGTEIEFPAQTQREVIASTVRRETARLKNSGGALNLAKQPVQGFNEGLMGTIHSVPDAFGEVVQPAMDLVKSLIGPGPNGGEEAVNEKLRSYERGLLYPDEPVTAPEKIFRAAGKFAGQNVLPAGAMLAMAPAASAGPALERPVQAGLKSLMDMIAAGPGRAAAGEAVSSLGAGAGGEIANQLFPGNEWAQMGGSLAGGMAAPVVATGGITGWLLRRFGRHLLPGAVRDASRKAIADVMSQEMDPASQAQLARGLEVQGETGANFSVAELTDKPSFIATQREIEREASGSQLDAYIRRRRANQEKIEQFEARNRPAGSTPAQITDDASAAAQRAVTGVETMQRDLGGSIPRADLPAGGAILREQLNEIRSGVREEFNTRAAQLGINDQDVTQPFMGWAEGLMPPREAFTDTANLPPVIGEIAGRLRQYRAALEIEDPVARAAALARTRLSYSDMKNLRERVSDDLIDALGASNPSSKRIRALSELKSHLDTFLDELPFGDAYRQFRRDYMTQYVERFENAAALKVRQRDNRAFYRTADESVANAFFKPDSASDAQRAMQQYRQIYGNDPQAMASMEAAVLDDYRTSVVRDGQIDPRLAANWMREHEAVLRELPNLQVTPQRLTERATELHTRQQEIEDQSLSRILRSYDTGASTAEDVFGKALRDPRVMGQLVARVGHDEEAMGGLRRWVWDQGTATDDIQTFLDNPSVKLVLSADHRKNLLTLFEARNMANRVPEEGGSAIHPNPASAIESRLHMGLPQIASRIFAVQSGRTSWRFILTEIGSRIFRGYSQEQAETLLHEALYNPEVAKDLAQGYLGRQPNPATVKRLNAWLLTLGATPPKDER